MVDADDEEERKLPPVVSDKLAKAHYQNHIDCGKEKTQYYYCRKMFGKQMIILRYVSVIEVGNAHVEHYLQDEGKVENGKIKTVFGRSHNVLHRSVYSENPKRFYQKIQRKKKDEVCNEFASHKILSITKNKGREIFFAAETMI